MGQYYKIVNLDTQQYLHPHKFDAGLKLMELASGSKGVMKPLAQLLRVGQPWFANRIVIGGDYADEGRFVPQEAADVNLYVYASENMHSVLPAEVNSLLGGANLGGAHFSVESSLDVDLSSFNVNPSIAYAPLLHSKNWKNFYFKDFDDVLEFLQCPATAVHSDLMEEFNRACRWSLHLCRKLADAEIAEFSSAADIEISPGAYETLVPVVLSRNDKKIHTELKFPCSAAVFFKHFGVTATKYNTMLQEIRTRQLEKAASSDA